MARKRVILAYITDDSQRKASFKKRRRGLINKLNELTVLCGVEACVIIYSPYDREPVVWPSRPAAISVLERFQRLSDINRVRRMVNQEIFMRQRIKKAEDQLIRVQRENKLKELEIFMLRCLNKKANIQDLDPRDVPDMRLVIKQFVKMLEAKKGEWTAKQAEKEKESDASHSIVDVEAMAKLSGTI